MKIFDGNSGKNIKACDVTTWMIIALLCWGTRWLPAQKGKKK